MPAATVTGNAMVFTFEAQDVIAEGTPGNTWKVPQITLR